MQRKFTIAPGPFEPNWESLRAGYACPAWFRDAKFGIWAHWGAQCVPEAGDWYARNMYIEGGGQYQHHLKHYGHPSAFGYIEILNLWKAEQWDPERLLRLFRRAGARYFVAMASHHDNFDAWKSRHSPWNSVRVGPRRDIIGLWAAATRRQGLPFGVTYHVSPGRVWREFMPVRYGSDQQGPLAGVPYDAARLTKADGRGTWWEGLDPRDFYGPVHTADDPCPDFVRQFLWRVDDLLRQHRPDLLYFDDPILYEADMGTFLGLGDLAPQIAAHYYNLNRRWHGGRLEAIFNIKDCADLAPWLRSAFVQDFELTRANRILPAPWQTDTSLGPWHYDRGCGCRSAQSVIHELADIVSKNGNMLLGVPMHGSGAVDPEAVKELEAIGRWLAVNGEAIYGTRPWRRFGDGEVRFTAKGDDVYAIALAWPRGGKLLIKALAQPKAPKVMEIRLLGRKGPLKFRQDDSGLQITLPSKPVGEIAFCFRLRVPPG